MSQYLFMSTILKPPVAAAPVPAPSAFTPKTTCQAEMKPDGTMIIAFTVTAEAAKIFERQAAGRNMEDYLWNTRGLRHFEHQYIG